MNTDWTSRFVSLLDADAKSFTFQIVPEPKDKPTKIWPQVLHGSLNNLVPTLTTLNRQGAGIYITVNETDRTGRRTANITRIRAVWQDDDAGYSGSFPIAPSMVIATSPGKFQRYWLADGLSQDNYRGLMRTMMADYGSDAQTGTDLARVLRVPGFYHNKAAPYLVRIIEASGKRYTREELLTAFPPVEQAAAPPIVPNVLASTGTASTSEEAFRIGTALQLIDADPYAQWIQIGQILHHHYQGDEEGLVLWMEWAMASSKFNHREHFYKWTTFGKSDGARVGLGTLFQLANKALYGRN